MNQVRESQQDEREKIMSGVRYFFTAFLVALVASIVAKPALAEIITFEFTGTVTSVPPTPPYGLSIVVGSPVSGGISYDPSASYIQPPPSGMSVVIGGATIQSAGNASLQVLNNSNGVDQFGGYFTPISVNGLIQPQFSHAMNFTLQDTSEAVFSSTALPKDLDVNSFDGRTGAIFAGDGITVSFSIDTLEKAAIPVKIDIKPGSFPNTVNPKVQGVIPVAILTTKASDNFATFDATTVDPTTVRFGSKEALVVQYARKDVDGDGDPDLILQFRTQQTGIICGNTSAILKGATFSKEAIKGTDSIRTVDCP